MKLPCKIRIGGITYQVSASKQDGQSLMLANLDGQCRGNPNRTIIINPGLEPEPFHRATVHELLHAADYSILNGEVSESHIQGLSVGFAEALWDLGVKFERPDETT